LTKQSILLKEFDVAILTPRINGHKPLFMSAHWHGKPWINSFAVLSIFLTKKLKINVPDELTFAIYENHFIAKRNIYHEYVESCLTPVMEYMEENKIFSAASGYCRHKEIIGDFASVSHYQKTTGLTDWPIGVFLLERLFSIWINDRKYSVQKV
jgi:hypothetical protein